ncbi:MAG: sugar ABC transporter permease [Saprospiraceae bacterium]|nr:sugar ABC transporter permease [Saprospiraceae bacterium]
MLFPNINAKIAAIPMVLTTLVVFWWHDLRLSSTPLPIPESFLPKANFIGLDQYERLWSNSRWAVSIENLAFFGVMSMVFTVSMGFLLAVLMDQKIRFEDTFRTIMLYPFALSFIVTGLVWQWILNPDFGLQGIVRSLGWDSFVFDPLHNPDTVLCRLRSPGLWQGTGFVMCLMLAGLRGIDEDIWKAARVDGIPTWKTYLIVVIPMMRPVFITTLVIVAAGIIKLYDLVVAMTSGGPGGNASQVPAMYVYDYMFQAQNLGQGFAASTMMLLSVLIVLIPWAYLEFE